jgi:hypothetical protein
MNAIKKLGCLTVCATVLFTYSSWCQWNADPAINTPVNTTPGTNQLFSQMTPDGSGGTFITWIDATLDLDSSKIYAQHLSSTGTKLWAANGVDLGGAGTVLTVPQIVTDGNGGAIVSWIYNNAGTLKHYVQKISSGGQTQWTPSGVEVCAGATISDFFYQFIPDNQGGAILLWNDQRLGQNQVYAQRIGANGNLLWPANGLECSPTSTNPSSFEGVADSTGGLMLCWTINTGLQLRNDVYAQHFSESGIAQWAAPGKNLSNFISDQLYPKIIKDSLDSIIVIWQDFRLDPVMSQIYGQRVSGDGNIKWQPGGLLLADSIVEASTVAKIVTDTSRGAIIAWLDDFPPVASSSTAHLFAVRVDSMGATVWQKKEIATWTDLQIPTDFKWAADFNGGAWLSWGTWTTPGNIYEIFDLYAQHVLADGSLQSSLSGQFVSSAPMSQLYHQMACDSSGVAFFSWSDLRNMTDYDLYATRLPALSTLPVTWLDFSGVIQGTAVQLTWKTSNEINNTGFTIQRSPEGILYDSIGFRPASSVVQDPNVYTFTDMHPLTGVNYYRLQQKDFDGKKLYSKIIRLDFNLNDRVRVSPNPASKYITITGAGVGSSISLYGMDGRKYREVRSSSSAYVTIDIGELPKGIYIVRVISRQVNLQSPATIAARLVKL